MVNPDIECVVSTKDRLGETPLWCERSRKLWWIDIEQPKVQSFDPSTGTHQVFPVSGTYLGSLALTESDKLLVAVDLDLKFFDPKTGNLSEFVEVEHGVDNRLNDGRVDPRGRMWIGTMDNEYVRPNGSLYRVDPDGTLTRMFGDVKVTNGIAVSPDGRTLYFTDTRRFLTWTFDLEPEQGTLSNRRLFADYSETGERPDGACIDADGRLWTVFFAGARVVRYGSAGKIDLSVDLPVTNPTAICFGGPELKTLYITTATKFLSDGQLASEPLAGSVLAIEGIGQGMPENRFGV